MNDRLDRTIGSTLIGLSVAATMGCSGRVDAGRPHREVAPQIEPDAGRAGGDAAAGARASESDHRPNCATGEAALLAISDRESSRVRMWLGAQWTAPVSRPVATALNAYRAGQGGLGIFFTHLGAAPGSFTTMSRDGLAYDADQPFPLVADASSAAGPDTLVTKTASSIAVSRLGGDGKWLDGPAASYASYDDFGAAVTAAPGGGQSVLVAARATDGVLFDQTFDGTSWLPIHRHEGVEVRQNEVEITAPRVVALEDGDVVVVFMKALSSTLAATTRHDGLWTAPLPLPSVTAGTQFAAARTPTNEVIVTTQMPSGLVLVVPFSRTSGWGSALELGGAKGTEGPVAVATGICGDDALVAYGDPYLSLVKLARIRGAKASIETVFEGTDVLDQLSLVTRPSSN